MNILVENLKAARALIDTPEKWTKGAYGRTADHSPTSYRDPRAVCHCMLGALRSIGPADWLRQEELVEDVMTGYGHHSHIPTFNDAPTTTHADVLAVFDMAIERAEAR